ncbi:MAG: TM2 domain-containing protein [Kosmotoga sp.]|nr:MAG: TM2 domain-containing protein [Kosmotoga sp.]
MYCPHCGKQIPDNADVCVHCGRFVKDYGRSYHDQQIRKSFPGQKSKIAAGLLGIFLGGIGVHRFYLGFTGIGIAQIIVTAITLGIGSIWGFIEGILILTGAIDQDADGLPLKD